VRAMYSPTKGTVTGRAGPAARISETHQVMMSSPATNRPMYRTVMSRR